MCAISPEARQEHQGKPGIPAFAQTVDVSAACACAYVRFRQKRLHMEHVFGRVLANHPVRSHSCILLAETRVSAKLIRREQASAPLATRLAPGLHARHAGFDGTSGTDMSCRSRPL